MESTLLQEPVGAHSALWVYIRGPLHEAAEYSRPLGGFSLVQMSRRPRGLRSRILFDAYLPTRLLTRAPAACPPVPAVLG